jgi:hypothetical protein
MAKLSNPTISVRSVLGVLLMSVCASAAAPSQQTMIVFPISGPNRPLVIPLNLDGKPVCFLFDTGSSTSIFDSRAFPMLQPVGPAVDADTPGGRINTQLFDPPKLSIGPWNLADSGPVVRMDLSPHRAHMDLPIVGVLGVNVWRRWVVQMDFDGHQLRFFLPDDHPHPEWGSSISMEGDDVDGPSLPKIRLSIGDFADLFVSDSGADKNSLPETRGFDMVLVASRGHAVAVPMTSIAGLSTVRLLRSPNFQVGDLQYSGLLFDEIKDWKGSLGLEFLSRHLVTMDWPNHKLYLKPGKEFRHYDEDNMGGIGFERRDSKTIVYIATPTLPAYQAGLRVGDEIVEINGKAAKDYDVYDLKELMRSKDGLRIIVKFQRDKTVQTTFSRCERKSDLRTFRRGVARAAISRDCTNNVS